MTTFTVFQEMNFNTNLPIRQVVVEADSVEVQGNEAEYKYLVFKKGTESVAMFQSGSWAYYVKNPPPVLVEHDEAACQ